METSINYYIGMYNILYYIMYQELNNEKKESTMKE